MSLDTGLRDVGSGLLSRVRYAIAQARRTTPGPALVRLIVGLSALGALVLAVPSSAITSWAGMLVVLALGVAMFPRSRWVGLVAILVSFGWLVTTLAFGDPVTPWRLGALMVALYVMHSSAALAAVLPYDCSVRPAVLLRWAGRTGAVLGASLALGLGGMFMATVLPAFSTIVGPMVGSLIAAGLAFLLVWHVRHRGSSA
jgi:hypothetical protein